MTAPEAGGGTPATAVLDLALCTSGAYREFIEEVVRQLPNCGRVVLLGHAGQILLKDRWDTLKVLVTAPRELLQERLRWQGSLSPAGAAAMVDRSDTDRCACFRHVYHVDWRSPSLYDLTINTARIPESQAVSLICSASLLR